MKPIILKDYDLTRFLLSPSLYDKIPVGAIDDILKIGKVYKSPYGLSFYSKRKEWDHTEHETIRISDHWNFYTRDNVHCPSLPYLETAWAMGVYDDADKVFKITKMYKPADAGEIVKYREALLNLHRDFKRTSVDLMVDKINYAKHIGNLVRDGKVKCYLSNMVYVVVKINNREITIVENDEKQKLSIDKIESDIYLIIEETPMNIDNFIKCMP